MVMHAVVVVDGHTASGKRITEAESQTVMYLEKIVWNPAMRFLGRIRNVSEVAPGRKNLNFLATRIHPSDYCKIRRIYQEKRNGSRAPISFSV